jgi:peptidoglycan/LPS O-acetylase OafA/YrhL
MGSVLNRQVDSSAENLSLRAIAMLGIMLHNFCHWLPGIVDENEFEFHAGNFENLQTAIFNPDSSILLHLFSYFGHYGVSVFVFLSGYGIVLKYEQHDKNCNCSVIQYIKYYYLKLLKLLVPGYVIMLLWRLSDYFKYNDPMINPDHIVAQILMYINFYPNPGDIIYPGPYWFLGMLLQLYLIYRIAIYKRHWCLPVVLMVLCTGIQFFFLPDSSLLIWMKYNFIGSMLPFGLGVLYARHKLQKPHDISDDGQSRNDGSESGEYRQPHENCSPIHRIREGRFSHINRLYQNFPKSVLWIELLLSLALVYITGMNMYSWILTPVFAITAGLCFVRILPDCIVNKLKYIGTISAGLFIIHPVVRSGFVYRAQQGDIIYGLSMYLFVSFAGAIVLYFVWKYLLPHIKQKNNLG